MATAFQQPRRCTVSDQAKGLVISIPPRREWAALFLAVWLAFWTFIGGQELRTVIRQSVSSWPIWLIGWALGELWASYAILNHMGGSEIILANSDTLRCTRKIFVLGWPSTYQVRKIQNLRFQRGLNRRPSRIAFDYGARTISFGKYIGEVEACELVKRIRQRCGIADPPQEESGITIGEP